MPRTIHTIEFPLSFSQHELEHIAGLLEENPRERVAEACLALRGATKRAIAGPMETHPTRVFQYLREKNLPRKVLDRFEAVIGLPRIVLPPERPGTPSDPGVPPN
jgi:hypothetical protein